MIFLRKFLAKFFYLFIFHLFFKVMTDRVIALEDVDVEKIILSPIMFIGQSDENKETHKITKSVPYVKVWYEFPQNRFCIFVDKVESYSGVQKYRNTSYISTQLTQEQSQKLQKMEDRLAYLLFDIRNEFLRDFSNLSKMTTYTDIHFLMASIIQTDPKYEINKMYLTQQEYDLSNLKMMDQITTIIPSQQNAKDPNGNEDTLIVKETKGRLLNMTLRIAGITFDEIVKVITQAKSLTFSDSKDLIQNGHTGFVNHDITEAEIYELYEIGKNRI